MGKSRCQQPIIVCAAWPSSHGVHYGARVIHVACTSSLTVTPSLTLVPRTESTWLDLSVHAALQVSFRRCCRGADGRGATLQELGRLRHELSWLAPPTRQRELGIDDPLWRSSSECNDLLRIWRTKNLQPWLVMRCFWLLWHIHPRGLVKAVHQSRASEGLRLFLRRGRVHDLYLPASSPTRVHVV